MKAFNKNRLIQAKQKAELLAKKANEAKSILQPANPQRVSQEHFNRLIAEAKGRRYESHKIKVKYLTKEQIKAREKVEKLSKKVSKSRTVKKTHSYENLVAMKVELYKSLNEIRKSERKVSRQINEIKNFIKG